MAATVFKPSMLNSVHELKSAIFTGEDQLVRIGNMNEKVYVRPSTEYYCNRFQVAWVLVTSPFRLISYLFFKSVATFLQCGYISSLSARVHYFSNSIMHGVDRAINQLTLGARLIVPTFNSYKKELSSLFTLPPIPRAEIKDPTISSKLFSKFKEINFNWVNRGLCHGGTYWFNFLMLKALDDPKIHSKFETVEQCARAITDGFKNGQPLQAALLQSLYGTAQEILNIEETLYEIDLKEHDSKKDVIDLLSSLPCGIYHVKFPEIHSISLILTGDETLVLDDNVGLIRIEESSQLYDIIQSYGADLTKYPVYFAQQSLKQTRFQKVQRALFQIPQRVLRMFG